MCSMYARFWNIDFITVCQQSKIRRRWQWQMETENKSLSQCYHESHAPCVLRRKPTTDNLYRTILRLTLVRRNIANKVRKKAAKWMISDRGISSEKSGTVDARRVGLLGLAPLQLCDLAVSPPKVVKIYVQICASWCILIKNTHFTVPEAAI